MYIHTHLSDVVVCIRASAVFSLRIYEDTVGGHVLVPCELKKLENQTQTEGNVSIGTSPSGLAQDMLAVE